jgi:hypothetical protein
VESVCEICKRTGGFCNITCLKFNVWMEKNWMLVRDKLEGMWKKSTMVWMKVVFWYLCCEAEEDQQNLRKGYHWLGHHSVSSRKQVMRIAAWNSSDYIKSGIVDCQLSASQQWDRCIEPVHYSPGAHNGSDDCCHLLGYTHLLRAGFLPGWFSVLKKEVICSFET